MTNIIGSITVGGISLATGAPAVAPGYDLIACGLSDIARRRDTVTSPWVAGETEVASVEGELTYELSVQCVGTDWANATALADALHAAVDVKTYSLVEVLGGHTESYACGAATRISKPIDRELMINARRAVTITIPVKRA